MYGCVAVGENRMMMAETHFRCCLDCLGRWAMSNENQMKEKSGWRNVSIAQVGKLLDRLISTQLAHTR